MSKVKPTTGLLPPVQLGLPKKSARRRESKRESKKNVNVRKQQRIDEIINEKAIKYQQEDSLKVVHIKGIKEVVETDRLFVDSIRSICHSRENVLH